MNLASYTKDFNMYLIQFDEFNIFKNLIQKLFRAL